MRIAQLDGLHTQLPEEHLGAQTVARCQDLWWSLYILDRQISFSLGLPMTTQDAEITTSIKAPENFPQDPIFSLQVKLSQMQTFILGGTCYWLLYFCNYSQSTESNIQDGEDPARTVSGNHKKYTPKHGWPSRRERRYFRETSMVRWILYRKRHAISSCCITRCVAEAMCSLGIRIALLML